MQLQCEGGTHVGWRLPPTSQTPLHQSSSSESSARAAPIPLRHRSCEAAGGCIAAVLVADGRPCGASGLAQGGPARAAGGKARPLSCASGGQTCRVPRAPCGARPTTRSPRAQVDRGHHQARGSAHWAVRTRSRTVGPGSFRLGRILDSRRALLRNCACGCWPPGIDGSATDKAPGLGRAAPPLLVPARAPQRAGGRPRHGTHKRPR
eukprot:scaffold1959_cov403-Prasinococcus_capsulatus_cf.AAC.1